MSRNIRLRAGSEMSPSNRLPPLQHNAPKDIRARWEDWTDYSPAGEPVRWTGQDVCYEFLSRMLAGVARPRVDARRFVRGLATSATFRQLDRKVFHPGSTTFPTGPLLSGLLWCRGRTIWHPAPQKPVMRPLSSRTSHPSASSRGSTRTRCPDRGRSHKLHNLLAKAPQLPDKPSQRYRVVRYRRGTDSRSAGTRCITQC